MQFGNILTERPINPRLAVELAIIHFNSDISSEELLDLREEIIYNAFKEDRSVAGSYTRDYYLYSRKCYIYN